MSNSLRKQPFKTVTIGYQKAAEILKNTEGRQRIPSSNLSETQDRDVLQTELNRQVVSKQRVADHGEVYTSSREVNAMLDLVKSETERIDSRFLEPACGKGNVLVEIIDRKLAIVSKRYAIIAVAYGAVQANRNTIYASLAINRPIQQTAQLPSPASGRGAGGEGGWNINNNPIATSANFLTSTHRHANVTKGDSSSLIPSPSPACGRREQSAN
ncbi:hypothetical protein QN372_01490 [Undibacterium sp. RTI2.1]|uniref:hypothetical protein n=1 Tax=unclassified Undibacterium TaxID=2630295 RepID=UPI002B224589|nr:MULTISPECIES: hypothetical protein [unclassified Undibacterium]MEB0029412.1 hypothetical protein [Undibacterium sp. RTI2.1]MEB0115969.1 hypothetical protein [Undibacterium sp. RTI2.2]